jgi:hypothetical protein
MLKIRSEFVAGVRQAQKAEDLFEFLQNAIELEHSTIPAYLTAAFSIKPGFNERARSIIVSVANQEMLHMTIAANVLNALGGSPVMDKPGFIPLYPGPLPMNVHEGLVVGLEKATRGLIYRAFMTIEEPERPIKLRVKGMAFPSPSAFAEAPEPSFATIGQFYDAIKDKIREFGEGAFGHPSNPQVVDNNWFPEDQLFVVKGVESACKAIDVIVGQGEGTRASPLEGTEGEPAHYYRLAQIVCGRMLVKDPSVEEKFSYSGEPVPLDPAGVWNLYPDAKIVDYQPNSRERNLVQRFNYSYTALLKGLQKTFNGAPDNLGVAIGAMFEMKLLANDIVSTAVTGTNYFAAPTFEYTPEPL